MGAGPLSNLNNRFHLEINRILRLGFTLIWFNWVKTPGSAYMKIQKRRGRRSVEPMAQFVEAQPRLYNKLAAFGGRVVPSKRHWSPFIINSHHLPILSQNRQPLPLTVRAIFQTFTRQAVKKRRAPCAEKRLAALNI